MPDMTYQAPLFGSIAMLPTAHNEECLLMLDPAPRPIPGALKATELFEICVDYDPEQHPLQPIVEAKLDGYRAGALGPGRIIGRGGEALACASHCTGALRLIEKQFGKPMFFDGELTHDDGYEALQAAVRRGQPSSKITYWLFDAIPLEAWERCQPTAPLLRRRHLLSMAARASDRSNVGVLHHMPLNAIETRNMATAMWRQGFEGLVIKDGSCSYTRGRSGAWQRLKQVVTSDVYVTRVDQRGTSVQAKLASGVAFNLAMTAAQAGEIEALFKGFADVNARPVIEIAHNGFTRNGKPRHARFVRTRPDKRSI